MATYRKLKPRWVGPFEILEKRSPVVYRLKFGRGYQIHDVFHVSKLKPYVASPARFAGRPTDPPPPIEVEGHTEYEVEAILDHARVGRGWSYLVKWKGYGPESNEWVPGANLKNAPLLLEAYWQMHGASLQCLHDFLADPTGA